MYQIVVEDASGDKESIDDYTKIIYEGELNGVHIFEVLIETSGSSQRTKFASGNKIHIYRGSTLEMTGVIEKLTHTSSNFMRIQGIGEGDTNLKNAQAPAKLWTSTNTTGVASGAGNLISYASGTTAGTVENQTVDSFKSTEGMSVLVAIKKLCDLTAQDFSFDYTNNELDIEDHKGSAASISILNEAFDVKNVTKVEDDRTAVEKVTIIGAGYGDTQVTGSADSGAFVQGDKEITIIDKNITTAAEAADRATAEYNIRSGTDTTYTFQVLNPNMTFVLGDVITLYDDTTSTNTTLRIVRYKRTVTPNNETLTFQVRGTSSRYAAIDRLKQDKLVQQYATDSGYVATASSPLDITEEDNTDSATNPVVVGPFTISSSAPTIDKATLQIHRKNTLYDNPASSTGAGEVDFSTLGYSASNQAFTNTTTWHTITTLSTDSSFCFAFYNFYQGSGNQQSFSIRMKHDTGTPTYYPNGVTGHINDIDTATGGHALTWCGLFPVDAGTADVLVQVKATTLTGGNWTLFWRSDYSASDKHTHVIADTWTNVGDADQVANGDLKWRVYNYTGGAWNAGAIRSVSGTFDIGDITSEIDISGDLSGADEYYVAVYDVSGITHRYTGRVRIHVS